MAKSPYWHGKDPWIEGPIWRSDEEWREIWRAEEEDIAWFWAMVAQAAVCALWLSLHARFQIYREPATDLESDDWELITEVLDKPHTWQLVRTED
jgi:hypothetical protein